MTQFRPMLASECKSISLLNYPGLMSPKLNGIRCLLHPKLGPVTRNLKPVPNLWVRGLLKQLPAGPDGELIVGDPLNPHSWNETQSGIMSEAGKPRFTFYAFDMMNCPPDMAFKERLVQLGAVVRDWKRECPWFQALKHAPILAPAKAYEYENDCVKAGYEGAMWRDPRGPYKQGRSTEREGYLLKIKRFHDAEAIVIGFEEKMHNANTAKTNALGYTERSSHKANQVPMDTLGALLVKAVRAELPGTRTEPIEDPEGRFLFKAKKDEGKYVEFKIGTGFDDPTRDHIWRNRKKYMGTPAKFKFQNLSPDGKPIFPSFIGFPDMPLPKFTPKPKPKK